MYIIYACVYASVRKLEITVMTVGCHPPYLSFLTLHALCSLFSSPEEKGIILSTLDTVHLICVTKACSGFTRHLSYLFCRIILAPSVIRIILVLPDISLASYKSLAPTLHILLFKNIFSTLWLCNYITNLHFPLCVYALITYLCLSVLQISISIPAVLQKFYY